MFSSPPFWQRLRAATSPPVPAPRASFLGKTWAAEVPGIIILTSELTGASPTSGFDPGSSQGPFATGAWAELGQPPLGGLAGWKVDSGDVPEMVFPGRAGQVTWVAQ